MSASIYRQQLESYLKQLEVKADSVIDVAGASNPVSKRVKLWDVRKYQVLDNELERQAIHIDIKHDMNDPLDLIDVTGTFDIIFCLEMMDYIWNPVQACTNLRCFAKPGSKLIMTFPFVYPNHNPVSSDMLRFTKQGAHKLLRHAGFEIDRTIARHFGNIGAWMDLMQSDGYRYRGADEAGTLHDSGYIIEAHAV